MSWTQSTQISREEPNYEKDVGVLDWESFFPSDEISGIGERVQQAVIGDQNSSVTKRLVLKIIYVSNYENLI